jgi:hypothetical protein
MLILSVPSLNFLSIIYPLKEQSPHSFKAEHSGSSAYSIADCCKFDGVMTGLNLQ